MGILIAHIWNELGYFLFPGHLKEELRLCDEINLLRPLLAKALDRGNRLYRNQPTVPACGVAQSCNGCSDCPDLAPIERIDV